MSVYCYGVRRRWGYFAENQQVPEEAAVYPGDDYLAVFAAYCAGVEAVALDEDFAQGFEVRECVYLEGRADGQTRRFERLQSRQGRPRPHPDRHALLRLPGGLERPPIRLKIRHLVPRLRGLRNGGSAAAIQSPQYARAL